MSMKQHFCPIRFQVSLGHGLPMSKITEHNKNAWNLNAVSGVRWCEIVSEEAKIIQNKG